MEGRRGGGEGAGREGESEGRRRGRERETERLGLASAQGPPPNDRFLTTRPYHLSTATP